MEDSHATEFFSPELLCLRWLWSLRNRMSFAIAAEPPVVLRDARRHSNSRFAIVPRRDEGAESEDTPADV
jgi:hypothetical protein